MAREEYTSAVTTDTAKGARGAGGARGARGARGNLLSTCM